MSNTPTDKNTTITYVCYNSTTGLTHTNKFEGLHHRLEDINGRVFRVKYYDDVNKVAFAVYKEGDYCGF
jgi:hypothetical protein